MKANYNVTGNARKALVAAIENLTGEKGKGGAFAKWFFYIFYPLHLTLLWVIGMVL